MLQKASKTQEKSTEVHMQQYASVVGDVRTAALIARVKHLRTMSEPVGEFRGQRGNILLRFIKDLVRQFPGVVAGHGGIDLCLHTAAVLDPMPGTAHQIMSL
jgi:hypothetical protein